MPLVIVESPAKARTIEKYLGKDFRVVASRGHIRDLPPKDGSVDPEEDFRMIWEVDASAKSHIKSIADEVRDTDRLILATDPDREGEAISWHLLEVLNERKVLKDTRVDRVVFNSITERAVREAMAHPREIDQELVDAYLARRALDYLVGFTLSPVLWRKLPGARSAGRVQSVALRLVCDRELEIEAFKPEEYWTVEVDLKTPTGDAYQARLWELDGKKLDKFDLNNEEAAKKAVAAIEANPFGVTELETRPQKRNPQPPFTTSTLTQEAARKLGYTAKRTMQIAQRLYEGVNIGGESAGLITYMRTDGVDITPEAMTEIRNVIGKDFGDNYTPDKPRIYKTKAKNAQEAHEAVRPTSLFRRPKDIGQYLEDEQFKLYDLIWKRTIASQMESAQLERTTVTVTSGDKAVGLRATGSVVVFDGFLRLYQEGLDDPSKDGDDSKRLPKINKGEDAHKQQVTPSQHFTEPPPRYSEATLIKKLEELGIGRPSTYASILSVLQDRGYVIKEQSRFVPEDKGRLVTAFLESFFTRYVEYDFTASLEEDLDRISNGDIGWKEVLRDFWQNFTAAIADTSELRITDVLESLNEILGPHIFPPKEDGSDPRGCPNCADGRLSLKTGRFGAFIGCSNYPDCKFTKQIGQSNEEAGGDGEPVILGQDPETGLDVSLRSGRFGQYLQLGEQEEGSKEKPKRAGIPKSKDVAEVDLDYALQLLNLPRIVGTHPETNKDIAANFGRYGPYLLHDGKYTRLDTDDDVFNTGLNRAVTLIAERAGKGNRRTSEPLKELGPHPDDGELVKVMNGRYGPYVTYNGVNATIPKGTEPTDVTMEQAVELIKARIEKGAKPKKKTAKKAAKKTAKKTTKKASAKKTAKKSTAKKKTAKKATAKKSTAKKADSEQDTAQDK